MSTSNLGLAQLSPQQQHDQQLLAQGIAQAKMQVVLAESRKGWVDRWIGFHESRIESLLAKASTQANGTFIQDVYTDLKHSAEFELSKLVYEQTELIAQINGLKAHIERYDSRSGILIARPVPGL